MSTEDTLNLIGLRLTDQCSDCDRTWATLLDLGVYLKRCIACDRWVCRECHAHHWRGRVQFSCGHEPITVITPAEPPIEAGMHLGCPTCGQKAVLRPGRVERMSDLVKCLNCRSEMLLYGPRM